jgi:hypothetical protein
MDLLKVNYLVKLMAKQKLMDFEMVKMMDLR